MLIAHRNGMMVGKRLPYDAEIAYLATDGSSYLTFPNRLFVFENNFEWELTLSVPSATPASRLAIASSGTSAYDTPYVLTLTTSGYTSLLCIGYTDVALFNDTQIHTVKGEINATQRRLLIYLDGVFISNPLFTTSSFGETASIFAYINGNSICPSGTKIYHITAKNGSGVTTLDMIPVRVGSVGYMYDKVSGQIFGNSGTGSFILGPDA